MREGKHQRLGVLCERRVNGCLPSSHVCSAVFCVCRDQPCASTHARNVGVSLNPDAAGLHADREVTLIGCEYLCVCVCVCWGATECPLSGLHKWSWAKWSTPRTYNPLNILHTCHNMSMHYSTFTKEVIKNETHDLHWCQ